MGERVTFKLKAWRAERGLTQQELAEKAGLSARTIYVYEKDTSSLRNASVKTVDRIASVLGINSDQIDMGHTEEAKRHAE